jgi:hypothetical protein
MPPFIRFATAWLCGLGPATKLIISAFLLELAIGKLFYRRVFKAAGAEGLQGPGYHGS